MKIEGFIIEKCDDSPEARQIQIYCLENDIKVFKYSKFDKIPLTNMAPIGSVKFVEKILGFSPSPEYFPEFAYDYLKRNIFESDKWIRGEKYFVKPNDKHKRFPGFVTSGTFSKKKKGPLMYSDIVNFENEYRYYVSNGEILCGYWYDGSEEKEAPKLSIDIPSWYCGAIDMGETKNGLQIVEANMPYACGWYGGQSEKHLYAKWVSDGWQYLIKKYKLKPVNK